MLAHKYRDHKDKLPYPCFVQPKLNGVRMLYTDNQMQSRDQHLWVDSMLPEIREVLADLSPDFILDGELYRHGWSLQKINGAASVNRNAPDGNTALIQYHVFDCVLRTDPTLSFVARWHLLLEELSKHELLDRVHIVPTIQVFDQAEAESQYAVFKREQYEGMMYRFPYASYGFASQCGNKENRWTCLLKRKDFLDDEFPCIGLLEGDGKYSGMLGALVLQVRPGLTVNVGTGYSDIERVEFFSNPPMGKLIRIKYEMLSDNGTPLKPVFECVME